MCDECRQSPCAFTCPNALQKKTIATCEDCACDLNSSDVIYVFDKVMYCGDCVNKALYKGESYVESFNEW